MQSLSKGDRLSCKISADMDQQNCPTAVPWFANKQGFVSHVFGVNTPAKWRAAKRARANVIVTRGLDLSATADVR